MSYPSTLTLAELGSFLKVVQDSLGIRRHQELFQWLHNDIQYFLPHDTLIAAWGDFSLGLVHFDILSHLPGMRTSEVNRDQVLPLLIRLFAAWAEGGRIPFILQLEETAANEPSLGDMVAGMHSALIHGIKDERGRHDCLYVFLSSQADAFQKNVEHPVGLLLPYVDTSLRQIAHLPVQYPDKPDAPDGMDNKESASRKDGEDEEGGVLGLSQRELEIIHWLCLGKTNQEIGQILNISFFTVKNHLQRIFRKLDVLNRTQAVAKCERLGLNQSPGRG
jgi:transcriptional regulator EpsA